MTRKDKIAKSNAMRELDRAGIVYEAVELAGEEDTSRGIGVRMARQAGTDPDSALKTLVLASPSGDHIVCCIPVAEEVDLKKVAHAAKEKSLSLLPTRELESVTGYVRGACSPIGMRRSYRTFIDETAQLFDRVSVSGGRRGLALFLSPDDLTAFCHGTYADLTRDYSAKVAR